MQFVVKSVCVYIYIYIYIYMYIHSIHMHIRLHAVYVYIVTYVSYIYTYVTISTYVYTHIRTAQALNPKAPKSPTLRESGDHPIKLERYREDWHGPCARMTRTNREVYQVNGHPSTCRFAGRLRAFEQFPRPKQTRCSERRLCQQEPRFRVSV